MRGHIRRETTGTKRSPPSKWLSHVSQTLSGVMNNFCYLSFFFDFLVKPEVPDFHGCVLGMTTQINFVTNLLTINKALGAKEKLQICDDWCHILLATCLFTMEQPKTDTGTRQRQKKIRLSLESPCGGLCISNNSSFKFYLVRSICGRRYTSV